MRVEVKHWFWFWVGPLLSALSADALAHFLEYRLTMWGTVHTWCVCVLTALSLTHTSRRTPAPPHLQKKVSRVWIQAYYVVPVGNISPNLIDVNKSELK